MHALLRPIVRAHLALIASSLVVAPVDVSAQWLPPEKDAVSIGASVGRVELDGAEDSHPPAGRAMMWSVRVSIPIRPALSIDGEFSRSGIVESGPAGAFFRERRKDTVAAVYARVAVWRKGIVAIHPVVGLGVVKPTRQLIGVTFDPSSGEWSERRLSDTGYPTYPHTWALSWGSDVWFGTGRLAIVPEFRAHEHFGDPSPWLAARILRTVYGTVGVRYRF